MDVFSWVAVAAFLSILVTTWIDVANALHSTVHQIPRRAACCAAFKQKRTLVHDIMATAWLRLLVWPLSITTSAALFGYACLKLRGLYIGLTAVLPKGLVDVIEMASDDWQKAMFLAGGLFLVVRLPAGRREVDRVPVEDESPVAGVRADSWVRKLVAIYAEGLERFVSRWVMRGESSNFTTDLAVHVLDGLEAAGDDEPRRMRIHSTLSEVLARMARTDLGQPECECSSHMARRRIIIRAMRLRGYPWIAAELGRRLQEVLDEGRADDQDRIVLRGEVRLEHVAPVELTVQSTRTRMTHKLAGNVSACGVRPDRRWTSVTFTLDDDIDDTELASTATVTRWGGRDLSAPLHLQLPEEESWCTTRYLKVGTGAPVELPVLGRLATGFSTT